MYTPCIEVADHAAAKPGLYSGKQHCLSCDPYIPLIAAKVAEVKGIGIEEVALQTTKNAEELFSLPEKNIAI